MPPSPTSSPIPGSPSRDTPNVHPYAIKTSSSAVLTRTISTGHRNSINHHYTPLSPTKNAFPTKQSRYVPSRKHARSLSIDDDMASVSPPVHMLPSSALLARDNGNNEQTTVSDGEGIPPTPPMTWRVKRSDTLPSMLPSQNPVETGVQDLPKNPKVWTPAQLSVYLASGLRLKGEVKLPLPVARDIAGFVIKEHLSGRAFLRMKTEDFDNLGINQLWKDVLVDASRSLRQNIVQGRIMGFGSGSMMSSPSAEELMLVQEEDATSADPPAYSSLDPTRRRTSSTVPLQWEEDKKRLSKTSFRAGRVRGIVETYERSCSESSGSGSECDDREDSANKLTQLDISQLVCEPAEDRVDCFASGEMTSASEGDDASVSDIKIHDSADVESILSSPKAHPGNFINASLPDPAQDSPSIETLLNEQEESGPKGNQYQSWGAKAWEDEANSPIGVHVTAKRVPMVMHAPAHETHAPESRQTDVGSAMLPSVHSAPMGLTELFSQLTIQESPLAETTQDASVSMKDENEEEVSQGSRLTMYDTLEELRKRLEVVEQSLDEMERQDQERDEVLQHSQTEVDDDHHTQKVPVKYGEAGIQSYARLLRPFDLLCPTEPEPEDGRKRVKNYAEADPTISGLPRYMFLVSLGVVAITMRVVLKRIIGDKRKS